MRIELQHLVAELPVMSIICGSEVLDHPTEFFDLM